jgi:hypothetical protein
MGIDSIELDDPTEDEIFLYEEEICHKCKKWVETPKKDGPYEYYETTNRKHGNVCPICGYTYCDECAGWQENDDFQTVCADCLTKGNEP